jgi:hypothetical protein
MKSQAIAIGLALTAIACSTSDSTAPTLRSVAGTYAAARFVLYSVDTVDVLAGNGYFDADLSAPNRNLSFRYFFPARPSAVTGYVGQYYVIGDTVLFHSQYPVFANGLTWHFEADSLVATGWYATDTMVNIVLKKGL